MKKFAIFALLIVLAAPMNNIALAKFQITDEHIKNLDTFIDITKTLGIALPSEIKSILNTTTSSVSSGANITYGILLLSAASEIELMDMIMSQRYKGISTKYFNDMLDQHTSLFKHAKGVGSDFASFVPIIMKSASIQAALSAPVSPISALALNTFSVTDNTITAILALKILDDTRRYDAIWIYFDARRSGETHETAWFEAQTKLGIGIYSSSASSKYDIIKPLKKNNNLEQYFSSLWDKWGPYTTQGGVTAEAKRQFKKEAQGLLSEAAQEYKLAQARQETTPPSLLEQLSRIVQSIGKNISDQIGKFADALNQLVVQIGNKLGATVSTLITDQTPTEAPKESSPAPILTQETPKEQSPAQPPQITVPTTPVQEPQIQIQEIPVTAEEKENAKEEEIEKVEQAPKKPKSNSNAVACALQANAVPKLQSIILSEIAWMGTTNSANDEWIELKNISRQEITLANWQLQDKGGQIHFVFPNAIIQPESFYLLERTDDTTLPDIAADAIYTGGLNNSNEILYLFDASCQLQDKVEANPNWPAGDASKKIPMERTLDLQWRTAPSSSPRAQNTQSFGPGVFFSSSTNTGGGGGSALNPVVYSKILITELQASPIGERFIELYNPNETSVDLTDWYIQRKPQSGTLSSLVTSTNLEGKSVLANGYFLVVRDSSSFSVQPDLVLNNLTLTEHNTLLLKNPNGEVVDKLGFGGLSPDFETSPASYPPSGSSIARTWGSAYMDTNNNAVDFTTQTPTPKAANGSSSDSEAPEVSFNTLSATQQTTSFVLSWSTSSSDIDAFSLTHTVSPSQNGIFLKYWANGSWVSWEQEGANALAFDSVTSAVSLTAQDGLEYVFSITAKDAAGNESSPDTASTTVSLSKTVVMNEVAWAGTTAANTADEWIELYNNTGSPVDLTGWHLAAEDGVPDIPLSQTILAQGYFLLERSEDDETISDIEADLAVPFSGTDGGAGLSNNGETLKLIDAEGTLIDFVDASSVWPAGDNDRYRSMERIDSAKGAIASNWASNNLITHNNLAADGTTFINGTPRQENSVSKSFTTLSDLRLTEFNEITLGILGSPYKTTNILLTIPQGKTLKIDPGVIIEFFTSISGSNADLEVAGTLRALGTQEDPITFTSSAQTPNFFWKGIHFTSTSTDSEISWATISYARRTIGEGPSVLIEESSPTIKNATIENYECDNCRGIKLIHSNATIENTQFLGGYPNQPTFGIHIEFGNPVIQQSTFQNNFTGIFVEVLEVGDLPTVSENTFTGNGRAVDALYPNIAFQNNTGSTNTSVNGILLQNGTINQNLTWFKNDLPYVISSSFSVASGNTLTIQPGVTAQMQDNVSFTVYGTLNAQGTDPNHVTFTSFNDCSSTPCPGAWNVLSFVSPSTNSALKYMDISYGGKTTGNIYAKDASVEIENVTSSYAKEAALYLENSSSTVQNSSFTDSQFGLKLYGLSYPVLQEGLSFENNDIYDIFIQSETECDSVLGGYATSQNTNCP